MNIKLLDLNLNILALIDDYESLYYEQKYDDIGTCTLTISAFSENFKMINKNMILYLDKYNCWYIEEINIENDIATITALNLSFIFSHRIILPPKNKTHLQVANKLTGEIAKIFIDNSLITSPYPHRNINMVFEGYNVGHKAIYESRYGNLFDEIQVLCKYSAIGFKVGIDIINQHFICCIYEGRDMSEEIIFCELYDNIDDIKINNSNSGYKNFLFIAGEGEGVDREIFQMSNGKFNGFELREDIIEVKPEKQTDEEGNEIPEDTSNIIEISGLEFFENNCEKTSIEALVLNTEEEVEIGDIVTIISKNYGLQLTQRITEINVEYTKNTGKTIGIIVGNQKPTLSFSEKTNTID